MRQFAYIEPLETLALQAIEEFKLQQLWKAVQALHNPVPEYHSLGHIITVAGAAVMLARLEHVDPKQAAIAGLLHDLGHTGGIQDDECNVLIACGWAEKLYEPSETTRGYSIIPLERYELNEVIEAIRCTEYNVRTKSFVRKPYGRLAAILRDADLCMPFLRVENRLRMQHALACELNAQKDLRSFLLANMDFFKGVEWHTATARNLSSVVQSNLSEALAFWEFPAC